MSCFREMSVFYGYKYTGVIVILKNVRIETNKFIYCTKKSLLRAQSSMEIIVTKTNLVPTLHTDIYSVI